MSVFYFRHMYSIPHGGLFDSAAKANWSYMGNVANFSFEDEHGIGSDSNTSNDAPIVKRLGRFRDLKSPNSDGKPKRRLSTAELIDLESGGVIP